MMLPFRVVLPVATALVVAACSMPMADGDAETRAVIGDLVMPDEVDLPADAEMVVTFTGLQGEVLAEERRRIEDRDPPYPFHLLVPSDRIGTVVGRVQAGPSTLWQSVSVLLDEGPDSVELGALALDPVEAGFTPAAGLAALAPEGGTVQAGIVQAEVAQAEVAQAEAVQAEGLQAPGVAATAGRMPEEAAGAGAVEVPPAGGPIRLSCGESQISVTEANGAADITVGETVVEMQATEAGGRERRYAVPGDPATYLALDGSEAELSLAGAVFPDCTVLGRAE